MNFLPLGDLMLLKENGALSNKLLKVQQKLSYQNTHPLQQIKPDYLGNFPLEWCNSAIKWNHSIPASVHASLTPFTFSNITFHFFEVVIIKIPANSV